MTRNGFSTRLRRCLPPAGRSRTASHPKELPTHTGNEQVPDETCMVGKEYGKRTNKHDEYGTSTVSTARYPVTNFLTQRFHCHLLLWSFRSYGQVGLGRMVRSDGQALHGDLVGIGTFA